MQPSDGKVHEIPIDRIRQATCAVGRRLRRHLLGAAPPRSIEDRSKADLFGTTGHCILTAKHHAQTGATKATGRNPAMRAARSTIRQVETSSFSESQVRSEQARETRVLCPRLERCLKPWPKLWSP